MFGRRCAMKTVFRSRSKTIRCIVILLLPILFLLHPYSAFSEETIDDALKPDDELEEELKYLQAETYVITASRIKEKQKVKPKKGNKISMRILR